MWVLFIGAPWWVRWLLTALLLAPIVAVPVPDVAHSAGWAWGLVVPGIYSLVLAAVAAALQRPVRALRRGEIPANPAVLAAAMACQRRARRWHRTPRWWVPVPWGLPDTAVGSYLERLRAAAKSALAAAAASADAGDPTALPPRRVWRPARVAIIAGLAIVALVMVFSWPTPTPTPQRRNANAGITFTAANPKMPDASLTKPGDSLTTPGDPSLSRYDAVRGLPSVNKAMHDANIITPDQQAAFLAQIAEESGCLGMVTELPWGLPRSQWNDGQAVQDYFNNKYANINGNGDVSSGDGYNYRGRGILQITGKSNYAAVSEKLYGDDRLVKNPDVLSQPDVAGVAAAAYWNENNLNRFIPPGQPVTPQQFQDLGSTINTGHPGDVPNNADERVKYWEVAKAALGVT